MIPVNAVYSLTLRERLLMKYWLDGIVSFEKLGDKMGVSRQRARVVYENATNKLIKHLDAPEDRKEGSR